MNTTRTRRPAGTDGASASRGPTVFAALLVSCAVPACAQTQRPQVEHPTVAEATAIENQNARCHSELESSRARVEQLEKYDDSVQSTVAKLDTRLADYREIAKKLAKVFDPGQFKIVLRDGRMVVQMPNEILFDFGSAELRPQGKEVLLKMAAVLKDAKKRSFLVAGHTDDVPVDPHAKLYHSNWQLSTLRALAVVEFLQDKAGVPPEELAAAGYGKYLPEASNATAEGRQENRRTEIILMPTVDELPAFPSSLNTPIATLPPPPAEKKPVPRPEVAPKPAPPTPPKPAPTSTGPLASWGVGAAVGAGTAEFTGEGARGFTAPAGIWDVRLVLGTRRRLAIEGDYSGGAQSINALGLDNDSVLVSTSLGATARLNMLASPLDGFQPYVLAGAAWRRYGIVNSSTNTSDLRSSDNVFEVPVGVGVDYRINRWVLDLRGVFRPTVGSDLFDNTVTANHSLNSIGAIATIGFAL